MSMSTLAPTPEEKSEDKSSSIPEMQRNTLFDLLYRDAFREETQPVFKLSSGKMSRYFVDCKKVSLSAEGAFLIGEAIFDRIKSLPDVQGVGGMTLGADPIATAVSVVSFIKKKPIPGFIVRKERKEHGTRNQIEGSLPASAKLVVIEDVVTTGGSTLRTIDILQKEGHSVIKVIALIDRLEGGSEEIAARGFSFESLYTVNDFIAVSGQTTDSNSR